jgi:hypothetical protein
MFCPAGLCPAGPGYDRYANVLRRERDGLDTVRDYSPFAEYFATIPPIKRLNNKTLLFF